MAQRSLAVEKRSYRAEAITQAARPMLRPQGCESECSRGSRWLNTRQRGAGKCSGLQNFLCRECGTTQIFEQGSWSDQCFGKIALAADRG